MEPSNVLPRGVSDRGCLPFPTAWATYAHLILFAVVDLIALESRQPLSFRKRPPVSPSTLHPPVLRLRVGQDPGGGRQATHTMRLGLGQALGSRGRKTGGW